MTTKVFDPSNREHKAIVLGAMAAADAFGRGRLSSAREQLTMNDIIVSEPDVFQGSVFEWGQLLDEELP